MMGNTVRPMNHAPARNTVALKAVSAIPPTAMAPVAARPRMAAKMMSAATSENKAPAMSTWAMRVLRMPRSTRILDFVAREVTPIATATKVEGHGVAVHQHHQPEAERCRHDEPTDRSQRTRLGGSTDDPRVEMQADVEHEEHHAELADDGEGVVRFEQAEQRWAQEDAGCEFAEDRRVAEAPGDPPASEGSGEHEGQVQDVQTHVTFSRCVIQEMYCMNSKT